MILVYTSRVIAGIRTVVQRGSRLLVFGSSRLCRRYIFPVLLGLLWLVSPAAVFLLAAAMAGISLCLALLIPRHPAPGRETIFSAPLAQAAE